MAHQLYRHFDADGLLLYVGISISAVERLRQHRITSAWFRRITTIRVEHFENETLARNAETEAIRNENPIFNKQRVQVQPLKIVSEIPQAIPDYLERNKLTQTAFAEFIGASHGLIWQWINRRCRITPEWAMEIEKRTKGEIARSDLRPDVWERAA